ncbi:MBL fold metallo-hydrolase [[Clostridium] polysaccharolyticum]|uniref:Glyoxylase, beta-lactamase superfamily II n=1 Tax=[Clostridium] polysaccharolyticum TaxID=29364 RepID=A0A1I0DW79_9FIRM|nr:MBL fold metallo-hydrolase [[Clostridium] polysaccharolyticum]SET36873.1 Glyoxylase, beta-lactamase superfamily II [[Clostridium] polysaccharolyticum]
MQDNFELNGLKVKVLIVGMVQTNCYVLSNVHSKKAVVVDPGDQGKRILSYLREEGLELEGILLTHGHFDHIMAVKDILENYHVPVYAFEEEQDLLEDARLNCSVQMGRMATVMGAFYKKANDTFEAAGFPVKLIGTPGHTKGSCCFYFEKNGCLFSGDTLFMESVGRTDLPTGNGQRIVESVRSLMNLPADTIVFTGHGEATTIKYESANNPFLHGWE